MNTVLSIRVIKIGDTCGICLPEVVLDRFTLGTEVELAVQQDRLVLRPLRRARAGWDAQFQAMAAHGDEQLLDAPLPSLTCWDTEEWE